jgi:hypothetical protein
MAIGGVLGRRKFPVSCERVAFSRIGGSSKSSSDPRGRKWEFKEGERERERERERVG